MLDFKLATSSMSEKKIIFLCTKFSAYFFKSLVHWTNETGNSTIIIHYRQSVNAPFNFKPTPYIQMVFKDTIGDLIYYIKVKNPDALFIGGWIDSEYKEIGQLYYKQIPVILGLDNPFLDTIRQNIGILFMKFFQKKFYNYIWIPGYSQYIYAKKLGFEDPQILRYLYCGNDISLTEIGNSNLKNKQEHHPRIILYVGRLVEYKNAHNLSKIFHKINKELNRNWVLLLVGEGELRSQIEKFNYEDVKILGFVQPDELLDIYRKASLFCLPSANEHWGVVVQEAASCGLPLILSDSVESGKTFLIDGYNGFSFKSNNWDSLAEQLRKIMNLSEMDILYMSKNSSKISQSILQEYWSAELTKIL